MNEETNNQTSETAPEPTQPVQGAVVSPIEQPSLKQTSQNQPSIAPTQQVFTGSSQPKRSLLALPRTKLLLIIIVILGVLGFVGWNVYQKSPGQKADKAVLMGAKPDAVMYGYFDGLAMKVNSYDLTSNQKKQLFEQSVSEPDTRSRPFSVLNAQVSSDKQMVAYRFVKDPKFQTPRLFSLERGGVSRWAHLEC